MIDELACRSRPKAEALRRKVEQRLQRLASGEPSRESGRALQQPEMRPQVVDRRAPVGQPSLAAERVTSRSSEHEKSSETTREARSQDDVQRRSGVASIRGPGEASDAPRAWSPKPRRSLTLEPTGSLVRDYAAAVDALIEEMRRTGSGSVLVELENGALLQESEGGCLYEFYYDENRDVLEGSPAKLHVGTRQLRAVVTSVSAQPRRIVIAIDGLLGDTIKRCLLQIDNTAVLVRLLERLEQVQAGERPGFSVTLATKVVTDASAHTRWREQRITFALDGLNPDQARAVRRSAEFDVSYVWGPPGTGKTKSLGAVIRGFFEAGQRVLICSNTNQAVDQVLLKLCEELGRKHPALAEGRVLRIGTITQEVLRAEWSDCVALDEVVERLGALLQARRGALEQKMGQLVQEQATIRLRLEPFAQLDELAPREQAAEALLRELANGRRRLDGDRERIEQQVAALEAEKERVLSAGFFGRLVRRRPEVIERDLARVRQSEREVKDRLAESNRNETAAGAELRLVEELRSPLRARVWGEDREALEAELRRLDAGLRAARTELGYVEEELEELRQRVLNGTRIVGGTVTKCFWSPDDFGTFDLVVVDEASMVLVPALFLACGMSTGRVLISGDPMQLPPIVASDEESIQQAIGADVFRCAGAMEERENVSFLSQQYRMDPEICELVSGPVYSGRLQTSQNRRPEPLPDSGLLTTRLIVIDTSTVGPFCARNLTKSRYNLVHALIVRNACRWLAREGVIAAIEDVGVATPYSAQARLIRRALHNEPDLAEHVVVGTVHRFQGDERRVMLIDLVDSYGIFWPGLFLTGTSNEDKGVRLLNVAVTRAREALIFIANLDHLDRKLPNSAVLRRILCTAQREGRVLDSRNFLDRTEFRAESFGLGVIDADLELPTGVFDQGAFDRAFRADLARAQKSVFLASGFVTPRRVAELEPSLRALVARRVTIRIMCRPPHQNGSMDERDSRATLDALEKMGVIVDCCKGSHQKLIVIDGRVTWFGSLNVLSFNAGTSEAMLRYEDVGLATMLLESVAFRPGSLKKEGPWNPRCPECQARTFFAREAKFGPYWQCERRCGWSCSADRFQVFAEAPPGGEVPNCPECGEPMRRRAGQFGAFWGCSNYPRCSGTREAGTRRRGRTDGEAKEKDR
ncbi:MAG: AAA family ATPase [Planctomycetes bacterium]|nr:AAA family ATPase [Planctomycetota bacterium]